jgi:hypothetical protein
LAGFDLKNRTFAVNPLKTKHFSVPFLAGAVGSGAPSGRKAL